MNVWYDTAKILTYFVNISGSTGPIFAIFREYESTLSADNKSGVMLP